MRRKIINHFKVTTTVFITGYILVYLIASFIEWSFDNPIQWILDIPSMDPNDRGCILGAWFGISFMVHSTVFFIRLGMQDDKKPDTPYKHKETYTGMTGPNNNMKL